MQQPEPTTYRIWISVGLGILGISLFAISIFVTDDPAHQALTTITQTIMIVSGSACVMLSVILFFIRNNPEIWS